jgi:hypothetical protein
LGVVAGVEAPFAVEGEDALRAAAEVEGLREERADGKQEEKQEAALEGPLGHRLFCETAVIG